MSRRTPVVAVKSGRTPAGRRAASSHTAAVAGGDVATEALFRQTGIIRTDTLESMFDVALLLERQPLPAGPRVGIVTNAGGPGILAADACAGHGLDVPSLSDELCDDLRQRLPADVGVGNPLDLTASADGAAYHTALTTMAASGEVDAVVVLAIPTGTADTAAIGDALVDACGQVPADLPVVSVFGSERGVPTSLRAAGIPTYAFPEDAASALGLVRAYADWRERPLGDVVRPDGLDADRAREVVRAALRSDRDDDGGTLVGHGHGASFSGEESARGGTWLSHVESHAVLRAYGVPMAEARVVGDPDEAASFQEELGSAVVVKTASPIHTTDVGAIRLDLRTPADTAAAVRDLRDHLREQDLGHHAERFLVQEMVHDGVEMVVGVTDDPNFGPLIVTGMGGTLVELVRDVAVRVTPITDRDVTEMLDQLRMRPLLDGYRGAPAMDVAALTDLLHRIGALVEDVPEVVELDCNPVFVRPDGGGVVAVDVRMRIAATG